MDLKKALENYVNLYVPIKKEQFQDGTETYSYSIIRMIITWLVVGFAVYLSYRCNNGFNLGAFLLAFFFSPCFILYHLATSGFCGLV